MSTPMVPQTPLVAAIYARKSTEQNDVSEEAKSVQRQIDGGKAYAARKGWMVDAANVYVDDGVSGAEFQRRPGLMRMLNSLGVRAPFQVLIMSEETRFGRRRVEAEYCLQQISDAGVRVFYYLEDREAKLDDATGSFMESVRFYAAQMQRERVQQHTSDVLKNKAERGYVPGGRVFGYKNTPVMIGEKRDHVEYRIEESEAAVVRAIFEQCRNGRGYRAIAHHLNAEGAPAPKP